MDWNSLGGYFVKVYCNLLQCVRRFLAVPGWYGAISASSPGYGGRGRPVYLISAAAEYQTCEPAQGRGNILAQYCEGMDLVILDFERGAVVPIRVSPMCL